jgi:tetratricopeptide (TPR) repeat protein
VPVKVGSLTGETILHPIIYADLSGCGEDEAQQRLLGRVKKAVDPDYRAKPQGRPGFPGGPLRQVLSKPAFPPLAISNVPIRVPTLFMGRDDAFAAIETALRRFEGRLAITALHGLRGVGKTTLAAAFAERHRGDYRATWWIRAQTEPTLRADLVALGVRLGWVGADDKEEPALTATMEQLRHEGEGILLIFDNATNAEALSPYLPRGGAAHVLVTSNAPDWRKVAEPVELRLWPQAIGADYLIARTGRAGERAAAEVLSEVLGGLPLAHEQAAAYCERLGISLTDYRARFEAAPARLLDADRDAPAEFHDGLTVAKAFALAIGEAAKLHPAAELLIAHAALLAPEPIPLFVFSDAREHFGEPLASMLADDGLDEAVAALRAFALIDREAIRDEREATITTDCILLHRLVRQVAAARCDGAAQEDMLRTLVEVLAALYPEKVFTDPQSWPRARRLDALALALVGGDAAPRTGTEAQAAGLLDRLASYRHGALAAYTQAQPLYERALAIYERVLGPDHPDTAASLSNLALLLRAQGDLAGARPLFERALAIRERVLGPDHPNTAESLNNLASLLKDQGEFA